MCTYLGALFNLSFVSLMSTVLGVSFLRFERFYGDMSRAKWGHCV